MNLKDDPKNLEQWTKEQLGAAFESAPEPPVALKRNVMREIAKREALSGARARNENGSSEGFFAQIRAVFSQSKWLWVPLAAAAGVGGIEVVKWVGSKINPSQPTLVDKGENVPELQATQSGTPAPKLSQIPSGAKEGPNGELRNLDEKGNPKGSLNIGSIGSNQGGGLSVSGAGGEGRVNTPDESEGAEKSKGISQTRPNISPEEFEKAVTQFKFVLQAEPTVDSKIKLTWSPSYSKEKTAEWSSSPDSEFEILSKRDAELEFNVIAKVPSDKTSYLDRFLGKETQEYRVQLVSKGVKGTLSNSVLVRGGKPSPVTILGGVAFWIPTATVPPSANYPHLPSIMIYFRPASAESAALTLVYNVEVQQPGEAKMVINVPGGQELFSVRGKTDKMATVKITAISGSGESSETATYKWCPGDFDKNGIVNDQDVIHYDSKLIQWGGKIIGGTTLGFKIQDIEKFKHITELDLNGDRMVNDRATVARLAAQNYDCR